MTDYGYAHDLTKLKYLKIILNKLFANDLKIGLNKWTAVAQLVIPTCAFTIVHLAP